MSTICHVMVILCDVQFIQRSYIKLEYQKITLRINH